MIESLIDVPKDSEDDDRFLGQIGGLMADMMTMYPNRRVRIKVTLYRPGPSPGSSRSSTGRIRHRSDGGMGIWPRS